MKILIIILSLIALNSCQSDIKAKFEITNKTESTIDSINIKSFDHELNPDFLNLEPGETKIYWFDMKDIPQVDGDYLLTYKYKANISNKRFGYFTNGFPLEKVTKIEIQQDTVIIDQIYDDY